MLQNSTDQVSKDKIFKYLNWSCISNGYKNKKNGLMRFDNFPQSCLHHFFFYLFFIAVTVEFHFISVSRERKYFRNLFDSNVDKFFAWLSFAVSFCSFYFSFCFSDVFILTYAYNMQRNFFYTWKIYLFIYIFSVTFFTGVVQSICVTISCLSRLMRNRKKQVWLFNCQIVFKMEHVVDLAVSICVFKENVR